MKKLGAAVIGTGFIGPVHVEALQRLLVKVTGVLGSNETQTHAATERLSLPKAYRSYEEVLADAEVDVVHIATPNRLHFDMTRDALNAGKHVLCEKPLAMNSRESEELVALAERKGLAAGVNYNCRYYPLCLHVREMIRQGELGDVFAICGSYAQDWLFHPTDYNWRVLSDEGGELRAVADIGTHWLDLAQSVIGQKVTAVCADLQTVHPTRHRPKGEVETFKSKEEKVAATEPISISTDDFGCILLRFSGGARGCVWVSQVTAGRKNCQRFEISGGRCAVAWESERPNELWIGQRDQANQLLLRDPALIAEAARRFVEFPGGHNEGHPDTFKQIFKDFYESIRTGDYRTAPTYPTFADGHREILLCEAILQSHREQRWVNIA